MNLDRNWESKISTPSTKFVLFEPIGKTRWPPWPLIGWDIFDFFSEPLNGIQQNVTGSKISTPLYQVCGRPPWPLIGLDIFDFSSKTAQRNSTKLDSKQDLNALYQVCVFRADRKKKQDGRPGLWLAEAFSTSPLKMLNRIQRNLTGSKFSTSSTKFVFFMLIRKQAGRPGLRLA